MARTEPVRGVPAATASNHGPGSTLTVQVARVIRTFEQTAAGEEIAQPVGVGEEVTVGPRRNHIGQAHGLHHGPEQPQGGVGFGPVPDTAGDPAPAHPGHLPDGGLGPGQVVEEEAGDHGFEAAVGEREVIGGRLPGVDSHCPGQRHHLFGLIHGDHLGAPLERRPRQSPRARWPRRGPRSRPRPRPHRAGGRPRPG